MTVEAKVIDKYEGKIMNGLQEILSNRKWKEFLNFHSKFWKYSFRNSLLIFLQYPEATRVTGRKKWEELGRWVKKEEEKRPIIIVAPVFKEKEVVADGRKQVVKVIDDFIPVEIFDISQTEGKELPIDNVPIFPRSGAEEERAFKLYSTLSQTISIPVMETKIDDGYGFYNAEENIIGIKKDLSNTHKFKTLVHENTHYLLHGRNGEVVGKNQKEIESESVAYIVLRHFGIDTSDYSFNYIASWVSNDYKDFSKYWNRIQRVAEKTIEDIESHIDLMKLG
jgi:hypothetical protein